MFQRKTKVVLGEQPPKLSSNLFAVSDSLSLSYTHTHEKVIDLEIETEIPLVGSLPFSPSMLI